MSDNIMFFSPDQIPHAYVWIFKVLDGREVQTFSASRKSHKPSPDALILSKADGTPLFCLDYAETDKKE